MSDKKDTPLTEEDLRYYLVLGESPVFVATDKKRLNKNRYFIRLFANKIEYKNPRLKNCDWQIWPTQTIADLVKYFYVTIYEDKDSINETLN